MRRKDREINDFLEIFDILNRCDTVRIGIPGTDYPYIVPVSFGAEIVENKAVIYFHSAKDGMKLDLLKHNPNVCVEGDIFIKCEPIKHGITARYESVIGFGTCEEVKDKNEIIHGLRLLTDHYGYTDFSIDDCEDLTRVFVGKIVLERITGKRNIS